jgi:hypothetical protein
MSAGSSTSPVAPLRWSWQPTPEAPPPQAVVAHGPATVQALVTRLHGLPSAERERLSVVAAAGWLVVLGAQDDLPWVDGVGYAAPSTVAPALWLPTHRHPDLPHDVMAQALAQALGPGPLLLWPSPEVVLPLQGAQPASDAVLAAARRQLRLPAFGSAPARAPETR